jgi:hypothetical protein
MKMKTIPEFVPKIIEVHTDHNKVFDSLELWAKQFHINKVGISTHPHFYCTRCERKFNQNQKEKSTCYCTAWQFFYKPSMGYENKKGHALKEYVSVKDELGDVFSPEALRELYYKYKKRKYVDNVPWYDPSNRGKLNIERSNTIWTKQYTNKSTFIYMYRNVRTTNERRQYNACIVDENSPIIRGKRSKCNLVNSWDDLPFNLTKTWKNIKIKKQWMKNIK